MDSAMTGCRPMPPDRTRRLLPTGLLRGWLAGLRDRLRTLRDLDRLQAMDDRLLWDIGLRRCDVDHVLRGPRQVLRREDDR
jgi:uncharacterized protein YjiS (DUF1127 family)